jgi:hypothetical protein
VTLVPGAEKVTVKREKEKEINMAVGAGAVDQTDRGIGDEGGEGAEAEG